ncbi:MAG: Adaptive-response sensory-kinase SasA [Verrucomicrobiae bacterium]|nr:Adaptive-response sensory-kinase SasA [Verrucomicrobiae bacterium]
MARSTPPANEKLRHYEVLTRVSRVINSSLEPATVLDLVLREAVELMKATSGSLVLIDPHTQLLEIEVAIGLSDEARQLKLAIGRGVTGWVAKTGQPLRLADVSTDPRYISVRNDIRSELAVPLLLEGQLIGVLNVDSTRQNAFSQAEEDLLVALANQAAQVIHNSWLYEAVAHNARKLEALFHVAQSINSSLNLEDVLKRVTAAACRLMETKVCSLMLLNADRDQLELRACHGASADYLSKPPLPVSESIIGSVVRRRKPIQVYNVQHHDAYQHIELARQDGLVSLLSVPLEFGEQVIGALSVYSATPYRYSTQDMKILSTLASLAAVAITNAQAHEKVVQAEEQLRQAERLGTLGLLAAEVAHEIRNPLTVMQMLFHSLELKFPATDPRARDAEIVAEKMEHLNKIVERLLSYARSNEPSFQPVDLNALLNDVLMLTRRKLQQQRVELVTDLAGHLPALKADRGQLEQACLNLILNAAEAMPAGGQLSITTGVRAPGTVVVTFRDTGVGMTPEQQARLFEPFLTTKAHGTGLGLAIVYKIIVDAHQGRIEVESAPRQGTAFHILLPADGAP